MNNIPHCHHKHIHTSLLLSILLLVVCWIHSATTMSPISSFRPIKQILPRPSAHWVGDGFHVYPVFADLAFTPKVTPFLMFDYAAPKHFPPSSRNPRGVGKHPHRGMETVTMAFQGQVEHQDSTGKHGVIQEGDVQWMSCGRGIEHSEFHSKEFSKQGGTFEMMQLWVNLPKKNKMNKPRYQPILAKNIPSVVLSETCSTSTDNDESGSTTGTATEQAHARVIAGELLGTTGPAKTYTPVNLWDMVLPNKKTIVDIPYPPDHTAMIFVRRGKVSVDGKTLGPQDVGILSDSGDAIRVEVLQKNSAIVIMGGEPIDEPIAHMGPFVMNTREELQQAVLDYRNGRFGK